MLKNQMEKNLPTSIGSLPTSIGSNIWIIDKYFRLFFKNALKPYDINATEAMVLLTLYSNSDKACTLAGMSQDQLITFLHYDKSVMTRTMQTLEKKGYVKRMSHPTDSRSYLFEITDYARQFRPKLIDILVQWNEALLQDCEHADQLAHQIHRMARNAMDKAK